MGRGREGRYKEDGKELSEERWRKYTRTSKGSCILFLGHFCLSLSPSVGPSLWQLTLLIPVQAGQQPQSLEAADHKYIVGSLAKSPGVVCSCPGPIPGENGNLLHGGVLVIIFRLFLPWLTYSCCTYSVLHVIDPPFIAQPLAAYNSTLRLFSGRLPMSQCSSELGVLQTVCGLLKGWTKVGICRIKKALLHLRHTVSGLFVYTQCIISFF